MYRNYWIIDVDNIEYSFLDQRVCRIPNMIRYTISYENIVCTNGATRLAFNFSVLMIVLILLNMQ